MGDTRVSVPEPTAGTRESSGRTHRPGPSARLGGSPLMRDSPMPQVAPPTDLLALQRLIARRPAVAASKAGASRDADEGAVSTDGATANLDAPGPLPFKAKMEAGFGTTLNGVTAHTGPAARAAADALGTPAFTVGQKIAFASDSPSQHVVAHEVAHTLQQRNGGAPDAIHPFGGELADPLEQEAEIAARLVMAGGQASVTGAANGDEVQRFPSLSELASVSKDVYDALAELYTAGVRGTVDELRDLGKGLMKLGREAVGVARALVELAKLELLYDLIVAKQIVDGFVRLAKEGLALARSVIREIAALIYLGILLTEAEIVFFVNELAQLGSEAVAAAGLVVKLVARKVLQAWNAVASFLKWLAGKIAGGLKVAWAVTKLLILAGVGATFDWETGRFGTNLMLSEVVPILKDLEVEKLDFLGSLAGVSSIVHVEFEFWPLKIFIKAQLLTVDRIDDLGGFSCGVVALYGVDIVLQSFDGKTPQDVTLNIDQARLYSARINKGNEITCDLLTLTTLYTQLAKISDRYGWLANAAIIRADLVGIQYPGVPQKADLQVKGAGVGLNGILNDLPSGPAKSIPAGADVLPKDSRIHVVLEGVDANYLDLREAGSGFGGSFDRFHAELLGKDDVPLASIDIRGFLGSGSAGRVEKLAVHGAPGLLRKLRANPLVGNQKTVQKAFRLLDQAGIDLDIAFDIELSNIVVAGDTKSLLAKTDLALGLTIPRLPGDAEAKTGAAANEPTPATLSVTVNGLAFDMVSDPFKRQVGTSFDRFAAELRQQGALLASVELGPVPVTLATQKSFNLRRDGQSEAKEDVAEVAAAVPFSAKGNIGLLLNVLNEWAKSQLPPSVQKILAVVQALGIDATLSGQVAVATADAAYGIVGHLNATFKADSADSEVSLSLNGFLAGDDGKAVSGSFTDFFADLTTKKKPVATIRVEGVEAGRSVKQEAGKADNKVSALGVKKITITGDGVRVGALAGTLIKKAESLPKNIKAILQSIRDYAIAARAKVTLTGVEIGSDDQGHRINAEIAASINVAGVGTLRASITGFHERGDTSLEYVATGDEAASFDRLELTLDTAKKAQAARIVVQGERTNILGGISFTFRLKKVELHGEAEAIRALTSAAAANLRFLPQKVKDALFAFNEFKINGTGDVTLADASVSVAGGEVRAKGDLQAGFDAPGLGRVDINIKGFRGDVTKSATIVHFDSFHAQLIARLKAPADKAAQGGGPLASIDVTSPAEGAAPDAKATVQTTGAERNRAALIGLLRKNLKLSPQVQRAIEVALSNTTATADLTQFEVGQIDGRIVAGGSVSLTVDVQLPKPDKTTRPVRVELKITAPDARASAKAGNFAGFQSLGLRVLADGKEAAALTADNGAIDASRKSIRSESLLVTGDGALIQSIVSSPDILAAFPADIASKLQQIDKSQLRAAWATGLNVRLDERGLTASASQLGLAADVELDIGDNKTVKANRVGLVGSDVTVRIDDQQKLLRVDVKDGVRGGGLFRYETPTRTWGGFVEIATGPVNAVNTGNKWNVVGQNIEATGELLRSQTDEQKAAQAAADKQKSPQFPVDPASVPKAAGLIEEAAIGLYVPVYHGKWKARTRGIIPLNLYSPPGALLAVNILIEDNRITKFDVFFKPQFDFDGMRIEEAEIGKDGHIRITAGNAFLRSLARTFKGGDQLAKAALGQATVPLNLTELADLITKKLSIKPTGEQPKPKKEPSAPTYKLENFATEAFNLKATSGIARVLVSAPTNTTLEGATVGAGSSIWLKGTADRGNDIALAAIAKNASLTTGGLRFQGRELGLTAGGTKDLDRFVFKKFSITRLEVTKDAPAPALNAREERNSASP